LKKLVRENWPDFGENPKKNNNAAASFQRIRDIGSEMVMVTDFALVMEDLSMKDQDDSADTCQAITPRELKDLVSAAKNTTSILY